MKPKEKTLAEKVKALEIRNALKKLNEGKKTMTAHEMRVLHEHSAAQDAKASPGSRRDREIAESQAAAAGRIGCTPEEVKLAKTMGCTAFMASNRIHLPSLKEYIDTDEFKAAAKEKINVKEESDWEKRFKRARALREEHRLQQERGASWDAEMVKRLMSAGDQAMIDTMRRYLENEHPPLVEGKTAPQILKVNQKFLDEIIKEMKESRYQAMIKVSDTIVDDDDENEEEG